MIIENAGWLDVEETQELTNADGYFDLPILLCMICRRLYKIFSKC